MELNKKLVNFESMNENTKLTLAEALLYTKGLAGGYGGDFPLSTASKDSIYRVPATNKFYVCTDNYNGAQISAPNDKFVELSVWKNHDRLNNLNGIDLFGVLEFPYGVTQMTVQLKEKANINNTIVLLSCIAYGDLTARNFLSYSIDSNNVLKVITSSTTKDTVSYIVKYLF